MEDKKKILVVEDDKNIAIVLTYQLKRNGYDVDMAEDGEKGLNMALTGVYDLILLDIMLPKMNGFEVCEKIRMKSQVPIIFVTAREDEQDVILGLETGADDYVTKPFTPMELLARVNSHLRRYARFLEALTGSDNAPEKHILSVGGLELNEDTVEVTVDGNPVKLTPIEFKILQLLMRNPGRVFSAEEIYESVWNEKAIFTDTIMVHVRHIREKIEADPKKPVYLKVVWGVGYKIEKM